MRLVMHVLAFWVVSRILDILILFFRIRHSLAHLRPVILSADWSISRLQSWTCSSLRTVAEFVKLTFCYRNSATVRRLVQSPTLQSTISCGVHSDSRGKGIRVSLTWLCRQNLKAQSLKGQRYIASVNIDNTRKRFYLYPSQVFF